eukprot:COSAG04_NODE_19592_length_412_cov_2.105431_1_plen_72_part_10
MLRGRERKEMLGVSDGHEGVYVLASPFATPSCIYTGRKNPYFSAALTPAKMSVQVSAACETPRQRCGVVWVR